MMVKANIQTLTTKVLVFPLVTIIGIIDFFLGHIFKKNYEIYDIPSPDAVLTKRVDEKDLNSGYRSSLCSELNRIDDINLNLYVEFQNAVKIHPNKKALGTRKKLSVTEELQSDGKVIKKISQSPEYEWIKFKDVLEKVNLLSDGLLAKGLNSSQKVVVNAETRAEWLISALACFKINAPIVTLYATLGLEALQFGIDQTSTRFLIISAEQINKIQKILEDMKTVKHIIVMTDDFSTEKLAEFKKSALNNNIEVSTFNEIIELGNQTKGKNAYEPPRIDDLAIVMYTSGSTGNPKGVMISHRNLLTSSRSLRGRMAPLEIDNDIYIGYLPMAHVLELCTEIITLNAGIPVGYSSPHTITDASTAIVKEELGDLRVLNPTIMHSVPAVLEKLTKAVQLKIKNKGMIFQVLFQMSYDQKLKFRKMNLDTKLLDLILFNKISTMVVGRNLRFLMCAGALLRREVHEFVDVCLSPVRQAYGLTETLASGTSQLINQFTTETVGSVVPSCEIRLADWEEGNYRITDTPFPRGEIYIGGDTIVQGYYNMKEKTEEDFHVIDGIRFFATGDIGEMNTKLGTLRLIDRKKDIVKLSGGEYISLNKIEGLIKLLPFVDNCCLIARPLQSFTVCLICPNQSKLIEVLKDEANLEKSINTTDFNKLKTDIDKNNYLIDLFEKNRLLNEKILNEIKIHCLTKQAARFEIPNKVKFVPELWLPDTGLVTDSLKIKRIQIDNYYKNIIDDLYH